MTPCTDFEVATLHRLLKGIDRLPDGATGALVFTSKDAPQGTVLVEDNRVCWAAASNMEQRLTDILRHQSEPPLPMDTFEAIYEECYRDRIPLGETLVQRGLVTREGFWRSLLRHTAEAICVLASADVIAPVWASNRKRRYDAEYTFSTAQILCSAGSLRFEEEAEDARRTLEEITPSESVGVAYRADEESVLALAHVTAEAWESGDIVDLGNWARNALRAAVVEEAEDVEEREDPGGAVESMEEGVLRRAWRAGPIVYARHSDVFPGRRPKGGPKGRKDAKVLV